MGGSTVEESSIPSKRTTPIFNGSVDRAEEASLEVDGSVKVGRKDPKEMESDLVVSKKVDPSPLGPSIVQKEVYLFDNMLKPFEEGGKMGLKDGLVEESSSPKLYSCEESGGVVSSPVGGGWSVSSSNGDYENMKGAYNNGGEFPVKKAVIEGCSSVVQTQRYEKNSPLFASSVIFGQAHLEGSINQGG